MISKSFVLFAIFLPWSHATPMDQRPLLSEGLKADRPKSHTSGLSNIDTSDAAMDELLERYAPIIKLSSQEVFFPSSIEYMLPHYSELADSKGNLTPLNRTLLTPSTLHLLPQLGAEQYLSISEDHNAQPFLDDEAEYLFGPAGLEDGLRRREDGRWRVEEPVYAFWVDLGRGVVDLWYWTFYPYNFGKLIGPFGILGNHVADWEHLRIRTSNGTAVSADFDTHTGHLGAGTLRWVDVEKIDDRPVAYSAAGSHGIWPTAGRHIYADVLNLFTLTDVTDDEGALWDTQSNLVSSRYWDVETRQKLWHTGERSWLNFKGYWGNKGVDNCWWHRLVSICQLVDAPPGPNRDFSTPPDCTIAPLVEESTTTISSTYSFYLSQEIVNFAGERGLTQVKVEQVCGKFKHGNWGDDDEDDPDDGHDDHGVETSNESGIISFRGREQHIISIPPCKRSKTAVKGYKISLCPTKGKCRSTSGLRKVCSYREGTKGYIIGSAVDVDDPDEWKWAF